MLLAIDSGMTTGKVDGIATKDPAFGTDAKWINPAQRDQAEMFGYTVVEPGACWRRISPKSSAGMRTKFSRAMRRST